MTFAAAIQATLGRNPTVLTADQDIRRTEDVAEQVRASWLPTLGLNAAYLRLDDDRIFNARLELLVASGHFP